MRLTHDLKWFLLIGCFLGGLIVIPLLRHSRRHRLSNIGDDNSFHGDTKRTYISYAQRRKVFNAPFTELDPVLTEKFLKLVDLNPEPNHPELIRLIQDVVDPPSAHAQKVRIRPMTPQAQEVMTLFRNQTGLLFVEAGANDGDTASNTLPLEQLLGWTGLLVEMDSFLYTQLMGKSRHAFSLNACLSLSVAPTLMRYTIPASGGGHMVREVRRGEDWGGAGPAGEEGGVRTERVGTVPCFPLESILAALGVHHVHYLSLDVEGGEMDILRQIPFHLIRIDVLSVEWSHVPEGKDALRAFMVRRGFAVHRDITYKNRANKIWVKDFIFVRHDFQIS